MTQRQANSLPLAPLAPRAFSLIETVLSLGVIAILAISLTSLMVVSGRAIPAPSDDDQRSVQARTQLDTMIRDMAIATRVEQSSPRQIILDVPDRTGDSIPETITYAFSGNAGDPLTRTMNGAPSVFLRSITSLDIALVTQNRTTPTISGTLDAPEALLASYAGPTDSFRNGEVTKPEALCVYPVLDSDVTHWRLTRVVVALRNVPGRNGSFFVTVHPATSDGKPDEGSLLATQTRSLSTGSTATQTNQSFTFSSLPWRSANTGICIAIRPMIFCEVDIPFASIAADTAHTVTGTTSGLSTSWGTPSQNATMTYQVFGAVRRTNIVNVDVLHATSATIAIGLSSGPPIEQSARLWNDPEVE